MIDSSVYRRPDKPKFIAVRERTAINLDIPKTSCEIIKVDKQTECHVTPSLESLRMVEYASPYGDVLEPSAGTGNLVHALIQYGINPNRITAVERHVKLAESLGKRFDNKVNTINQCFLEFAQSTNKRFDTIVMNPPFRPVKKHVEAAINLLKKGGTLVVLVPESFDREGFSLLEKLDGKTFSTTSVKTKILEYSA